MSTSRPSWRAPLRAALAVAGASALVLVTSGVASAHVTAQPGSAAQGSYAEVAFRVPSESETASTVKLEVTLPTDHPVPSVRTTPMPGWTAALTTVPLNPPIQTDDGSVTQAVHTITWTAQPGTKLGPTEFADFVVSMGALPDNADSLVMPAVQTYDDGSVVRWDQVQAPGAPEPEHPAPVLKLVKGSGDAHGGDHHDMAMGGGDADGGGADAGSAGGTDTTARWLGGIGLVLGALGLGLGAGAVTRARKAGRG
jgi:uncharacterized protein YcnI